MRTAAVLTAAGSGSRLGHRLPKALVPLDGTPLVAHAALGLVASGVVDLLVVTAPDDHLDTVRAVLDDATAGAVPVVVTRGGPSRQASVAAALAVLPDDVDVVLVHDAARCLTPGPVVARVVAAVWSGHGAVVPVVPVTDTVLEVEPGTGAGAAAGSTHDAVRVVATPDRSRLRAVQTPQGFDRALLDRAHAAAAHRAHDETLAATDDSSLVAALGEPVVAVPGDHRALKITTARDLALAGMMLSDAADPAEAADAAEVAGAAEAAGLAGGAR